VADLATWQDGTVPGGPLAVPLPEVVAEVRERLLDGDFGELIPFLFGDIATVGYRDALGALPADSATLTTRIDPLPDPDSRVTLGAERDALGMRRAELHWELGQLDKWSAIRTLEILGEELGQAGVGRVRVGLHEDDDWPTDLAGGWHHMGTTRMSLDPSQGVVDPDCRVHGMDNLYIAGSSVFPTAGSGTPTMTIVALLPMTSAAAIGRAYLATGPDVADLASVRGALREKVPSLFGSDASSDRRLRELLGARTRADFGVGDVVRVEGWILARTEALLCAYVALLHDGPL
jgi:GMC oxidoreductase